MKQETNTMFRYLEKYVGTYRVKPELDWETGDIPRDSKGKIFDSFDDLYIPCKKGVIKHSYKQDILCWYCYDKLKTANNVIDEIKSKLPDVPIEVEDCGQDMIVYFNAKDIKKIATIVKPVTMGKNVKVFSSRNTLKEKYKDDYKVPQEDLDKLDKIVGKLEKTQKMLFFRDANKEFDKVIEKTKGVKYNVKEQRDGSGLKQKEFIHYIGMWDDYLKFIKKKAK